MTIGERIFKYRKKRGLTQRQLAEGLNVSVQAVSQWETGKSELTGTRLAQVARALGIPAALLMDAVDVPLESFLQIETGFNFPVLKLAQVWEFVRSVDEKEFVDVNYEKLTGIIRPSSRVFGILNSTIGLFELGLMVFDTGITPDDGDVVVVANVGTAYLHDNDAPEADQVKITVCYLELEPGQSSIASRRKLRSLVEGNRPARQDRSGGLILATRIELRSIRKPR